MFIPPRVPCYLPRTGHYGDWHRIVFHFDEGSLYDPERAVPSQSVGTHARPTWSGPTWIGVRPFTYPFKILLNLDIMYDPAAPVVEKGENPLGPLNTKWVLLMDGRLVYIPARRNFKVVTYPTPESPPFGNDIGGTITPLEEGVWLVFQHAMYWLPPVPNNTHRAVMRVGGWRGAVYFDYEGNPSDSFDVGRSTSYCMIFSPSTYTMVVEHDLSARGAVKVPDAGLIVMIRGNRHPLSRPPFEQWNLLRTGQQALGEIRLLNWQYIAYNMETFAPPFNFRVVPEIRQLARDIGRMTVPCDDTAET